MSIFNENKENITNNLINEENSDIKIKNDELNELTLKIDEKTTKLNRLEKEIEIKEKNYKEIIDLLNQELSNIQNELSQKQAEFDLFNIKLENSVITDKDEKIKYLKENIKNINEQFKNEQNKNIKLEEDIRKLKQEKKEQMKINEKNELKIHDLTKENKKLSTKLNILENTIKVKDKEIYELKNNNKNIKNFEKKIDKMNEINNDLNNIGTFLNTEINKIEEIVNKNKKEVNVSEIINTSEKELNKLIEDNPKYSYECINKDKLVLIIKEGMEEGEIQIELKNNGDIPWNHDTQLKMVNPSDIKIDDKTLKQQEPNEVNIYPIVFKELSYLKIKEYFTRLAFCSGGKTYGDIIIIKINIISEIEFQKINEFRKEFNLPVENYSDEKILNGLKNNNFNFESTIESWFN